MDGTDKKIFVPKIFFVIDQTRTRYIVVSLACIRSVNIFKSNNNNVSHNLVKV